MTHLRRYLEEHGVLYPEQLAEALRRQQIYGGSLDTVLLELELVDPVTLGEMLERACGFPIAPAELLDNGLVRPWTEIPEDLQRSRWVEPLVRDGDEIVIGVHPDLPDDLLGKLMRSLRRMRPMVTPECCLEKVAAERHRSVVPQRYAVLCSAYLSAVRRRPSMSGVFDATEDEPPTTKRPVPTDPTSTPRPAEALAAAAASQWPRAVTEVALPVVTIDEAAAAASPPRTSASTPPPVRFPPGQDHSAPKGAGRTGTLELEVPPVDRRSVAGSIDVVDRMPMSLPGSETPRATPSPVAAAAVPPAPVVPPARNEADVLRRLEQARAVLEGARSRDDALVALVNAAMVLSPRVGLFRARGEELVGLTTPQTALEDLGGKIVAATEGSAAGIAARRGSYSGLAPEADLRLATGASAATPCLLQRVDVRGKPVVFVYLDRDDAPIEAHDVEWLGELAALGGRVFEEILKLRRQPTQSSPVAHAATGERLARSPDAGWGPAPPRVRAAYGDGGGDEPIEPAIVEPPPSRASTPALEHPDGHVLPPSLVPPQLPDRAPVSWRLTPDLAARSLEPPEPTPEIPEPTPEIPDPSPEPGPEIPDPSPEPGPEIPEPIPQPVAPDAPGPELPAPTEPTEPPPPPEPSIPEPQPELPEPPSEPEVPELAAEAGDTGLATHEPVPRELFAVPLDDDDTPWSADSDAPTVVGIRTDDDTEGEAPPSTDVPYAHLSADVTVVGPPPPAASDLEPSQRPTVELPALRDDEIPRALTRDTQELVSGPNRAPGGDDQAERPRSLSKITMHSSPPPPPLPPPPTSAVDEDEPGTGGYRRPRSATLHGLPPPELKPRAGAKRMGPRSDELILGSEDEEVTIISLAAPITPATARGRIELEDEDWVVPGSQLASDSQQGLIDAVIDAVVAGEADVETLREHGDTALLRLVAQFPGPLEVLRRDLRALPPPSAHGPLVRTVIAVGPAVVPHLIDLYEHPNPDVRFYAAFVFHELRDARCMRPLAKLAFDANGDVRVVSMRVLETYRRSEGFDIAAAIVRGQLMSESRTQQLHAARASGTLRDIGAIPQLIELLASSDRFIQEASLESLCSITGQQHGLKPHRWRAWYDEQGKRHRVEWIIDSLRHRDLPVRRWAADELVRITGHRVPFSPMGDKRARDIAAKAWMDWWEARGRELFGG